MAGTPDSSRTPITPFLVNKTRYNGQGYPIVTATLHDEPCPGATATRAYAREDFGAEPGQFASK